MTELGLPPQEVFFEIEDLARLRQLFDVRDRTHGFPAKRYDKCFVGSEAVGKLVEADIAGNEEDAVRIGNMLIDAGVFHHVLDEHRFENRYLFYRFLADEDHGAVARDDDGARISWADFLGPLTGKHGRGGAGLQPVLPERDADLARFDQIDLDRVGVSPLDGDNAALLDCVHPRAWVDPQAKGRYNLVVLGAGAGGLVTAAAAAGVGARVALVESHRLGGDCLNVGCVPSKALLRSASAAAFTSTTGCAPPTRASSPWAMSPPVTSSPTSPISGRG